MSQPDTNEPLPVNPDASAAAADSVAPEPAGAAPAPAAALEASLAAARKEAADNYDRYLRSVADLENYRKRAVRDREDATHRALTRVLEDLVPVLDTLEQGLVAAKAPNAEVKTLVNGVEMLGVKLKGALAGHGLAEVNPVGKPFDPNLHEAIAQQPSADIPADCIAAVVRTGYTLNGRLVRAASVVVSTGAPVV
jgi:molecular chaperone GrpE